MIVRLHRRGISLRYLAAYRDLDEPPGSMEVAIECGLIWTLTPDEADTLRRRLDFLDDGQPAPPESAPGDAEARENLTGQLRPVPPPGAYPSPSPSRTQAI